MKKLTKQIIIILSVVLIFVCFDLIIYNVITKRYINDTSEGMIAKSIELDKFLPFEENSEIIKIEADKKITGELPVIDGAAALYPVFSAFVHSLYSKEDVIFDGTNFASESKLHYTNTRGAYKAIVDKEADIVFCVSPSKEQLEYAKQNNVELEFIPIGYEAFVFIVNKQNPIESLTQEQIRKIYSGEVIKWSSVGGDNTFIDALQRNEGSGSQSAMQNFMGNTKMKRNPIGILGRSIGFSFRYYVEGIVENGKVKMIAVDNIYPSKENIRNKQYPIVTEFYAVVRKNDPNPNIKLFIDFVLSEKGQRIIEESGYVSIR